MKARDCNMAYFEIGKFKAGDNFKPMIISDIGINHGGDINVAISIAEKAISAGARIIKHQTHIPDDEMSSEAKNVIPGNSKRSIYDVISSCALNESDEFKLKEYINSKGALFLSCLLYTSPSPRDVEESRMPSSA